MLEHPTVVAFNQSLGFNPYWKFETTDSGMDVGEIGSLSLLVEQASYAQSCPTKRKGVAASMIADVVSVAVTTD
jgi:hypothetical protein